MATTKYMIVGFRKSAPIPTLTVVKGSVIELVDSYKYVLTVNSTAAPFLPEKDESCECNYDDTLSSEFH